MQKVEELEFTERKWEKWSLQKESGRTGVYRYKSRRTGVYRQKVGELNFTDRKRNNWSLQIESVRTGVYRQKVGELEFVDLYFLANKKQEFTAFG